MNKLIDQILLNRNNPNLKLKLYHSLNKNSSKQYQPALLSIKIKLNDDIYNRIKSEVANSGSDNGASFVNQFWK